MMNETKKKRIAVSLSIVGSIVAFFLLIVIGYQIARMITLTNQKAEYERLLAEYLVLVENGESDLDYYHSENYLRWLARTYGYYFPEDKIE